MKCITLSLVIALTVCSVITAQSFEIVNAFPQLTAFDLPVQIVFLPDGKKLVVEKGGIVWIITADGSQKDQFIDLRQKVLSNHDKGLLSVALDPDFNSNKWVYFLYQTDPDSNNNDNNIESWGRLERYKVSATNPDIADLSTREILIGNNWNDGIPFTCTGNSHAIGTIRFGKDKTLLLSAGDGAEYSGADPGGRNSAAFQPGKFSSSEDMGAFRSQSLNSLAGKLLRVDKETGLGLQSNPFWDGNPNSVRSRVFSYGLRNPFRFAINTEPGETIPDSGKPGVIYIGDVGWNWVEEINVDSTGGFNFGWPIKEGTISPNTYPGYTSAYNGNTNVVSGANNSSNYENPKPYTSPHYYWKHKNQNKPSNPSSWIGNCVVVGAVYKDTTYPSNYYNNLFVSDYNSNWLRRVTLNTSGQITGWSDFLTLSQIVNMEVDPQTGELYAVRINGTINRIRYGTNSSPVIVSSVTPEFGLEPLTVFADASESYDPEDNNLSFSWDFDDGTIVNRDTVTHTFQTDGLYNVILTVTDNGSPVRSSQKLFQIVVGQANPPTANILEPADSFFFDLNQQVVFRAEKDSALDSSNYEWKFMLYHNQHMHPPDEVITGDSISQIMNLSDHSSSLGETYHWISVLRVEDQALFAEDTVRLFPKINLIPYDIVVTHQQPVSGLYPFDLSVKVSNTGEIPSGPSNLKYYRDDTLRSTIQFVGIDHNEDQIFNLSDTSEVSNVNLKFIVDLENQVYETNENDNQTEKITSLPVELLSFTSKIINKSVLLMWSTVTEINNFGFEIQRKNNKNNYSWEKIGFVQGYGTSNSIKNYEFIDNNILGFNKFYYRLKQIDNDGSFKFYDEIEVINNAVTDFALHQNYPNPFNPETKISFAIPKEVHVKLEVYNILGDKIVTIVDEKREKGYYTEIFSAESFSSGVYFYSIKAEEFNSVKKLIVLK